MTDTNGSVDFTHALQSFTLNGRDFQRQKVPARLWAETLARVAAEERTEMDKDDGSVLFAVSADGLAELVKLAIRPADRSDFDAMYEAGEIEFGELTSLRDWLWEKMTERPFTSGTPSSDGPGNSSAPSSRDASPSQVEIQTG